jgi:hypothetical protein
MLQLTKQQFEEWYEEVIGEPITVNDVLWQKIQEDIEDSVISAIENKVGDICNDIYEENY